MKALIKILYFFLVLILLFLVIGIFFPKTVYIESSIQINASPAIVFDQVNNLKNWTNWEPWQLSDSVITYSEHEAGVGASYNWFAKGNNQGKILIIESDSFSRLKVDIDFGNRGKVLSSWIFKKDIGNTLVTWGIANNNLKYFERYFALFFRENMKNNLNAGLKKLKSVSEELRLDRVSEVTEVDLEQGHSIIITDSSTIKDMDKKMTDNYNKLKIYLERKKVQSVDFPFAIYYDWGVDGFNKFACGLYIPEKTWSWNEYKYFEVPSGHAIMVTHWGKFGSIKPYKTLDNYLKEKNLEIVGFPMEVYTTYPENEPDTAKWETKIYYMVKLKE